MTKRLRTQADIVSGKRYSLGYNAVDDTTRRRHTVRKTTAEAVVLPGQKRDKGSATARDDRRNMTILAWMIRRHLDNVSRFTPHFRIAASDPEAQAEIDEVNKATLSMIAWHGRRRQFDALGRHGRDEYLRMFEACKVISGDCGSLKSAGGKSQGIEGDRIRKPGASSGKPSEAKKWKNVTDEGLTFNEDGTRKEFCVCKREGKGLVFERLVKDDDMIFDAYWPERFDSNRGVSPLLTALNEAADVRESSEWTILKIKNSGLFGLAFTRAGSDDIFPSQGDPNSTSQSTEAAAYSAQVTKAVKARGMINLDLDPGDTVAEVESKAPNPNIAPFIREIIRAVLLSLDIPFTFYDSLTASFSARIADRNEYEESCEWKRAKNQDVLHDIYDWVIPMWAAADLRGFGKVLKTATITPEEVAASLRWVPAGRPWLDRSNEMSGHILALAAGVTSTPRICAAYGDDAYQIAEEQKEYLAKAGIPLLYAQGGQVPVNDLLKAAREGTIPAESGEGKVDEDG